MAPVRYDVDPEVVITRHGSATRIQRCLDSARHDKDSDTTAEGFAKCDSFSRPSQRRLCHGLALHESCSHPCYPCNPWLKLESKSQHFDRSRHFDMLVAYDEIQRSGCARLRRSRLLGSSWSRLCGLLSRRTFVFFVVHVQRANDENLPAGTCNFVQEFLRRGRRRLEREVNNVALYQIRGALGRARLG